MRLMQLIWLRRLLPKSRRAWLRGYWNKLLQLEQHLQERQFYGRFVKRGDLVFDIGANKGAKAAALLSLGARVIAVEPNPVCTRAILEGNSRAVARGSLQVECAAVAAQPGEIILTIFDSEADMTSGSAEFLKYARTVGYKEACTMTATSTTLDKLIERFGLPAFLKIDVEGMDANVLRGLSSKPCYLSFEYNTAGPLLENTRECFGQAVRLGFTEANFTEATAPKLLFDSWMGIQTALSQLEKWRANEDRWGDVVLR
jgi:FkbM family methyltransferase